MNRRWQIGVIILMAAGVAWLSGCGRNQPSERPPIHLNQNMDEQPKFKPQAAGSFFTDGSAMRLPVAGTVARGWLREDSVFFLGRDGQGRLVRKIPVAVTMDLLRRGRERFDIFCAPCHGRTGLGQGTVVARGMPPPPNFHDDRLRTIEDGHIFDVMTNGFRNMPTYRYQIPVADRWAIVAYFRALQRSRQATRDDLPSEQRELAP